MARPAGFTTEEEGPSSRATEVPGRSRPLPAVRRITLGVCASAAPAAKKRIEKRSARRIRQAWPGELRRSSCFGEAEGSEDALGVMAEAHEVDLPTHLRDRHRQDSEAEVRELFETRAVEDHRGVEIEDAVSQPVGRASVEAPLQSQAHFGVEAFHFDGQTVHGGHLQSRKGGRAAEWLWAARAGSRQT